ASVSTWRLAVLRQSGERLRQWQTHRKHGSFPNPGTEYADTAAVHLGKTLCERQAQSDAALWAVERLRPLHKQLKHVRDVLGCDPLPLVRHLEKSITLPVFNANADVDAAAAG